MTCNYKSWQKEPETVGSAEPLASLGWLSVNRNKLKAYQLGVRRLHVGSARYDVTNLTSLKTDTRGAQKLRASFPG